MNEFVPVNGYNGRYSIRKDGAVLSEIKRQILSISVGNHGYPTVHLTDDNGKRTKELLHRLLAVAFIPNPYNLATVNHKDKNKLNYDLSNLEWMSLEDNIKHGLNREYSFIAPDGRIHKGLGLKDFCAENGLTRELMYKVLIGQRPHHKGWTLYE